MNENIVPSDEILLKYAAGSLDEGVRLLVDAHFERVPDSRDLLRPYERYAGSLIAVEAPEPLRANALENVLALIGRAEVDAPDVRDASPPVSLAHGAWRWAGPGARVAPVVARGARTKLFLMRIARGRAMPEHGHVGREFTVVLEGAYFDKNGLAPTGAFVEQSAGDRHRPVVTDDGDCVCLFALEGPIAARGLAGLGARWAMR